MSLLKDPEGSNYYALLKIENDSYSIYSNQQVGLNLRKSIEKQLEQISERNKLKQAGINLDIIQEAKTNINIETKIITLKEILHHQARKQVLLVLVL